jgi:hypothetical protein
MVVGIIGIIVIVSLLTGYYLYSLSPSIQARLIPVSVSADAVQSFDQKLDELDSQIKAAVGAGENREISLIITEKEVNSK